MALRRPVPREEDPSSDASSPSSPSLPLPPPRAATRLERPIERAAGVFATDALDLPELAPPLFPAYLLPLMGSLGGDVITSSAARRPRLDLVLGASVAISAASVLARLRVRPRRGADIELPPSATGLERVPRRPREGEITTTASLRPRLDDRPWPSALGTASFEPDPSSPPSASTTASSSNPDLSPSLS